MSRRESGERSCVTCCGGAPVFEYIRQMFDVRSLSPHGYCLLWRPELLWSHLISDTVIALAYFSIPAALAYFLRRRRDIAFGPVVWAFAVFILACGATHVMSIWTLWNPDYGVEALVKVVTAAASIVTAIVLWKLMPLALAWPSPEHLQAANRELEQRVRERDEAIAALTAETAARVEAERNFARAQRLEAVGQLTGGVAHDFNNLMTIVLANLDRLERMTSKPTKAGAKALDNARTGARRAAQLTRQLLAFSRRQALSPVATDVNDVIREALELSRGLLGPGIETEAELADTLPPIRIDAGEAVGALVNLMVNARDAMPEGGRLSVTTRLCEPHDPALPALPAGEYVAVSVADTGTGMTPEILERAFEPFFTTKALGEGTGLGLSQVYGFVKQSGGDAVIASTPGQGARVTIYLPVCPQAAQEAA